MPYSNSQINHPSVGRVLVASALILVVVHIFGRFIYTPLLPLLVEDGYFTVQQGAGVATWNYVGYLLGAMLAMRYSGLHQLQNMLPVALGINVLCTLLQTQTADVTLFTVLRLINGISNGVVFVQVPALALEWLVRQHRASSSGLIFLGIGIGLIASSLLVSATENYLTGAQRWWPALILSVPLAWWGWRQMAQLRFAETHATKNSAHVKTSVLDKQTLPLFLSYTGGGLGYILPMTFLPVLVVQMPTVSKALVSGSWLLVAIATVPSPWLWNRVGMLMGDVLALKLNYGLQAAGVLAVVLLPNNLGVILCSLLVGCTFVGTVLLTFRLAREMQPHQGPRISGALVALYGAAQLAGPWLAKLWLDAGGSLQSAFWLGAIALVWAFVWSLKIPNHLSA